MKLIIQIPCLNEEHTLRQTLDDLPRAIPGIDNIEILVIDDGSTDGTVQVAKDWGVDYVMSFPRNLGLAKAFTNGLNTCLMLGADIIVNTDADNQYRSDYIQDLVRPILDHKSEIVIGCRPIEEITEFSWIKKKLQRLGSRMINLLAGTSVPDVTSGFRAFSRSAAMQLNIISHFTYTLETIIQAGQRLIPIAHVDIETNPKTRESRLFRNIPTYLYRSTTTTLMVFFRFKPMPTCLALGSVFGLAGIIPCIRFLYFVFFGNADGYVQSLILGVTLLIFGAICFLMGFLADQNAANRQLTEETVYRMRQLSFSENFLWAEIPNLVHRRTPPGERAHVRHIGAL